MKQEISLQKIDQKFRIVINEVKKAIQSVIDYYFEIILYGSVTCGEETNESGLDLLVLIDGPVDFALENQIIDAIYHIELKRNVVINLFIESKETWDTKYAILSLFYENIQREGMRRYSCLITNKSYSIEYKRHGRHMETQSFC